MKDVAGAMDRAEAFLIDAMSSNGSTLLSFAYAFLYFFKRRWVSMGGGETPEPAQETGIQ